MRPDTPTSNPSVDICPTVGDPNQPRAIFFVPWTSCPTAVNMSLGCPAVSRVQHHISASPTRGQCAQTFSMRVPLGIHPTRSGTRGDQHSRTPPPPLSSLPFRRAPPAHSSPGHWAPLTARPRTPRATPRIRPPESCTSLKHPGVLFGPTQHDHVGSHFHPLSTDFRSRIEYLHFTTKHTEGHSPQTLPAPNSGSPSVTRCTHRLPHNVTVRLPNVHLA